MLKNKLFLFFVVSLLFISFTRAREADLALSSGDRLLILVPHPDDEVLGCGGVIQKAVSLKLPVRIVFFTYGDANKKSFTVYRKRFVINPKAVLAMGEVRRNEAIAAGKTLGVPQDQLIFLGYPDRSTLPR